MIYLQEGHVVLPAGLGAPVQGSTPAKPKLQAKVTDSSTEIQTLLPDPGYDGLSSVMVLGVDRHIDSNIKPENIKSGVSILGVQGSLQEGGSGEINVDTPVYTEFVATYSGEYNVISPDVVKYVKKLVVRHPTYGYSEPTIPSDGKFHIDYHTNLRAYWYFDFEQYNKDHGYLEYYKCLPEGTFGSVDFTSGLKLNKFDLGSVNVIEDNSLPAYGKINIVNSMYDIKHIPENVEVYIKNNMSLKLKGIRSSTVYLFGNLYDVGGYTKEYIFKADIYSYANVVQFRQMGRINNVSTVFPFYPESGESRNVVDIHEETTGWADFGFYENNVNWVNSIDTFIIPSTYKKVSTFTFNDNIRLNKIVCFKDNKYTPANIKVVRESGTKQHNGTLFVPEGATGYDSWLTKLNTVGTWTIKRFKAVKTPDFKGSASGYYGYTDPNTGKHLFVDLN